MVQDTKIFVVATGIFGIDDKEQNDEIARVFIEAVRGALRPNVELWDECRGQPTRRYDNNITNLAERAVQAAQIRSVHSLSSDDELILLGDEHPAHIPP